MKIKMRMASMFGVNIASKLMRCFRGRHGLINRKDAKSAKIFSLLSLRLCG